MCACVRACLLLRRSILPLSLAWLSLGCAVLDSASLCTFAVLALLSWLCCPGFAAAFDVRMFVRFLGIAASPNVCPLAEPLCRWRQREPAHLLVLCALRRAAAAVAPSKSSLSVACNIPSALQLALPFRSLLLLAPGISAYAGALVACVGAQLFIVCLCWCSAHHRNACDGAQLFIALLVLTLSSSSHCLCWRSAQGVSCLLVSRVCFVRLHSAASRQLQVRHVLFACLHLRCSAAAPGNACLVCSLALRCITAATGKACLAC